MSWLLRNIIWFAYFFLILIAYMPFYLWVKILDKMNREDKIQALLNRIVQPWAKSLLKLAGVTVEVSGLENIPEGPVVFASNHQGYFDIPILLACLDRPYGFIAKVETKKIPVISGWMRYLHCVFLDRENPRKGLKAVNEAIEIVKSGHSIILFPEGTTSDGDEMRPFKSGALRVATKADVPVVPVVINGAYKILIYVKDGVHPAHIKLTVLPSVDVLAMSREEKKQLPQILHDVIEEELKKQLAQ